MWIVTTQSRSMLFFAIQAFNIELASIKDWKHS
jgi:hypothetical protein